MRRSTSRPSAAAIAAALALTLAAATPALAAATEPSPGPSEARAGVRNAQPSLDGARALGPAPSSDILDVRVYLADRNADELDAEVRSVSDPASPRYGRYLSAAQFRARYAPAGASVAAVRSFLTRSGLEVTEVPANRAYVEAQGTVAEAQSAFATNLRTYEVKGHRLRAAATAPTLPSTIAREVVAVSGLASISSLVTPDRLTGTEAPPSPAFVNSGPCSAYYGQKLATTLPKAYGATAPYAPCGYLPAQLQSAYGLTQSIAKGFDGRGVTVAITDAYASPTIVADATTYALRHGQPGFAPGQFRQVLPQQKFRYGYYDQVHGDLCGEQGWYGEETLDVEAVHAVAPGANITYVASRSCDNADFAATLNRVVDGHLADIVTNSWGGIDESNGSPQLDTVYQQVFYQAALQGIGMYFSSGDSGDGRSDNAGVPTIQSPANSTLVTAVGGTSLAVGRDGQRLFETGWSTGRSQLSGNGRFWEPAPPGLNIYGAGGGTSRVYRQPWYQAGVVPTWLATRYSSTPARVLPDVSALGDPNTGMRVGQKQSFPDGTSRYSEYRIGGTSLASPVVAGIMAIADQVAGRPHGFANPAIYAVAGSRAYYDPLPVSGKAVARVDFANGIDGSDGTVTTLRSLDVTVGTILRARSGYDEITGVGSPNGSAFLGGLPVVP